MDETRCVQLKITAKFASASLVTPETLKRAANSSISVPTTLARQELIVTMRGDRTNVCALLEQSEIRTTMAATHRSNARRTRTVPERPSASTRMESRNAGTCARVFSVAPTRTVPPRPTEALASVAKVTKATRTM